jgi:sugar lactone lactonase YvrE
MSPYFHKISSRSLCCLLFLCFLGARGFAQDKAAIFFTDRGSGKVYSADADGGAAKVLAKVDFSNLRGVVADVPAGRVYFADNGGDKIYRVNLDGTDLKVLVTGLGFPADLTMDRDSRKLYWCDQQKNHIRRCNVDGTDAETVVETPQPYYLDIDSEGGYLYWGTFFKQGRIYRRKIDGGETETLLAAPTAGLIQVRAVQYHHEKKHLYWVDREAHKIQRGVLTDDGKLTDIKDLYTDLDTPHGMVLDTGGNGIFWCDTGTNVVRGSKGAHSVMRGSLDGTVEPVAVFTGSQPWDIDVFRPKPAASGN